MRSRKILVIGFITVLAMCACSPQSWATPRADEEEKTKELTLEKLFPEKSVFGPSASRMSFSAGGRYAAYLYRPYNERRHGNDLWIFDVQTGESTRITSVSVLAPFQKQTRTVKEDRTKKAKKAGKSKVETPAGPADGISGAWSGRLRSDEASDGVKATIELTFNEDALSGTVESSIFSGEVTKGSWSKDDNAVSLTLKDGTSDLTATFTGAVDGKSMSGSLKINLLGITLEFNGSWSGAAAAADEDGGMTEDQMADFVGEKDADDRRAPRCGGVNTYTWAPESDELILTSQGDLYRYDVATAELTRLTHTQDSERDVQYLPDGSGYTYLRGPALMRVSFGDHVIHQLDPKLPGGETMTGYRISPDGSRLVFLANKGQSWWTAGQTVNIVHYRDRFAQVRQVSRHMPGDPIPTLETFVYLHELTGHMTEEAQLKKIFTHKHDGPRDILWVPEWAPDSSRVAFSSFKQGDNSVRIMESRFETEGEGEEAETSISDSYEVNRFFHNGGPTTPSMIQPFYMADSRRMVFISEISGYRQLHRLDPMYQQLDQLTQGRYEVYPIDLSRDRTRMFITATKDDPTQQRVFSVNLETAEMSPLSFDEGVYTSVAVNEAGDHVLATHADFGLLRELVAIDVSGQSMERLTDSHTAAAVEITAAVPEYFTYKNRHGQEIHGHMFKPDGWSASDKRPLMIYVYGGPLGTTKMATRGSYARDSYFFGYYMAKKHGFVTCTIDPRGVSGYGGLFEKSNFEQVGKPQVEDLVDGARWFIANQGVDTDRVAIHGWSFGGFQTQMCLYTEPDVFACGIAGAGPTEWHNYNTWYSTGTVGESRPGKTDLDKYSLLPLAKNLKSKLLLVHGMEDSNVLYQDTVRVYRELLKAGKEAIVELFLDPTGGHGLGGDVKTINRFRKYEEFLTRCVGVGEAAEAGEAEASSTEDDG